MKAKSRPQTERAAKAVAVGNQEVAGSFPATRTSLLM